MQFPRSRTPTPQRSHTYKEMYERRVQARRKANTSRSSDRQQRWKQSPKVPTYEEAEHLFGHKIPELQRMYETSRGLSPGRCPPFHWK
jgi:hypothetical protein